MNRVFQHGTPVFHWHHWQVSHAGLQIHKHVNKVRTGYVILSGARRALWISHNTIEVCVKKHKFEISDIFVQNWRRGGNWTQNTDHHWFISLMLTRWIFPSNLLQCVMLVTPRGLRAVGPAHSVRTGSTHAATKPNVQPADRTWTQEGTRGQGRKEAAVSNWLPYGLYILQTGFLFAKLGN